MSFSLSDLKVGHTYTIRYEQRTTTTIIDDKTGKKVKHVSISRNEIVGKYKGRGTFGSYQFGVGPFRVIPRSFKSSVIVSID